MKKPVVKMIKCFNKINEDLPPSSSNYRIYHSVRVANMMKTIATQLKLNNDVINQLYITGLYHDICKSKNNHGHAACKYLQKNMKKVFNQNMLEAIEIHSMKTSNIKSLSLHSKLLMDCDMIDKCTIDSIVFKLSKCDDIVDKYKMLLVIQKMLDTYNFNFKETKEKYYSMKGLLSILIEEYNKSFI